MFCVSSFAANTPDSSAIPQVSIEDINTHLVKPGQYKVKGYVQYIYSLKDCPVCGKGAVCEACMMYMIISSVADSPLPPVRTIRQEELVVRIYNENLKIGPPYEFVIQIEEINQKFNGESIRAFQNVIKLIGFTEE